MRVLQDVQRTRGVVFDGLHRLSMLDKFYDLHKSRVQLYQISAPQGVLIQKNNSRNLAKPAGGAAEFRAQQRDQADQQGGGFGET